MMGKNLVTWKVSDKVTMFPIFDGDIAGKLLIRNNPVFSPLFFPCFQSFFPTSGRELEN